MISLKNGKMSAYVTAFTTSARLSYGDTCDLDVGRRIENRYPPSVRLCCLHRVYVYCSRVFMLHSCAIMTVNTDSYRLPHVLTIGCSLRLLLFFYRNGRYTKDRFLWTYSATNVYVKLKVARRYPSWVRLQASRRIRELTLHTMFKYHSELCSP